MGPKSNVNAELENIHKLIKEIHKDSQATASKLDELVAEIRSKDRRIEALESEVAVLKNAVNLLSQKCDSNEQYSRRSSLRINNIPLPNEGGRESAEDVMNKVREVITETGADIPNKFIERAHRVGKTSIADDGTRKQQVIVKFTTWYHRTQLYKNRKNLERARVHLDLTQSKFKLLKSCQAKVRESNIVNFVFADVNCALCARMADGAFKYFSSAEQLDKMLS